MGARLERGAEICGIKASTLKKLMAKPAFDTPTASHLLGLFDPTTSQKLRELEAEGWINFKGRARQNNAEMWEPSSRAARLLMAKIGAVSTIDKGREAVRRLLAEVESAFNDPTHSNVVTKLVLFGSTLRGGDENGMIGDVDIGIEHGRRFPVGDPRQEEIEKAEREGRSFGSFFQELLWGQERLLSRIKKAGGRLVAIHPMDDVVSLDAQRQVIWSADPLTGKFDLTPGPIEGQSTTSPGPDLERPDDYVSPPPLPEWRSAKPPGKTKMGYCLFGANEHTIRHAWLFGQSDEDIAKAMRTDVDTIRAVVTYQSQLYTFEEALEKSTLRHTVLIMPHRDCMHVVIHDNYEPASRFYLSASELDYNHDCFAHHYGVIRDLYEPLVAWLKEYNRGSFRGSNDLETEATFRFDADGPFIPPRNPTNLVLEDARSIISKKFEKLPTGGDWTHARVRVTFHAVTSVVQGQVEVDDYETDAKRSSNFSSRIANLEQRFAGHPNLAFVEFSSRRKLRDYRNKWNEVLTSASATGEAAI